MEIVIAITILTLIVAAINYYFYRKADRLIRAWRRGLQTTPWVAALRVFVLAMNAPFAGMILLWIGGGKLHQIPGGVLKVFVYPFFVWTTALLALVVISSPVEIAGAVTHAFRRLRGASASDRVPAVAHDQSTRTPATAVLERRRFLQTAAAVVPVGLFTIMAHGVYAADDIEVSPLIRIPIERLPRAFDGVTITQISDLHTGPFIREHDLDRAVALANGLRSELVVVTGDILDGSLEMLAPAQRALARLKAPLGVYGILGNHDYYADRRRPDEGYPGCVRIMEGMQAAGIRMLRNSRDVIRLHGEELVVAGVDWTGMTRGNPNLYVSGPTRAAMRKTFEDEQSRAPRILLAHHPHVFYEAGEYRIDFMMAGHTHGGGQVVIAERNGRPIALGSPMFRWVSGLYTEGLSRLYVNRGVGFVGVPIRIQCPAEISRFQLVRA